MDLDWKSQLKSLAVPALILAVLIVIVSFRFSKLIEKTWEGTTLGRLYELRQAILLYYQDHNGVFPRDLNTTSHFGRYLSKIPEVEPLRPRGGQLTPKGSLISYGTGIPEGYGQGWYYNYESGQIFINSIGRDSRDISYTAY